MGDQAVMMAAMMLPSAAPAAVRFAHNREHAFSAVPFVTAYLAVWVLFAVASYGAYRPHGTVAAGIVTIAAGLYELTSLKRRARELCRDHVRNGVQFGANCVVANVGLMAMLLAIDGMSIGWMSAIAALMLGQKLLQPQRLVDLAVAAAIVALGAVILLDPSSVPGLMPTM